MERLLDTPNGPLVADVSALWDRLSVRLARYDGEGWEVERSWGRQADPAPAAPDPRHRALVLDDELVGLVSRLGGLEEQLARALVGDLLVGWAARDDRESRMTFDRWADRVLAIVLIGAPLALFGLAAVVWFALEGLP